MEVGISNTTNCKFRFNETKVPQPKCNIKIYCAQKNAFSKHIFQLKLQNIFIFYLKIVTFPGASSASGVGRAPPYGRTVHGVHVRSSTNGPCAAFEPSLHSAQNNRLYSQACFRRKIITCKTRPLLAFRARDFYEWRDYYSHFKLECGAILPETYIAIYVTSFLSAAT